MRYAMAKFEKENENMAYRIYISDSLFYQGENKRLTKRYYDILNPKKIDTRSGDDIAKDVITKLGLNF